MEDKYKYRLPRREFWEAYQRGKRISLKMTSFYTFNQGQCWEQQLPPMYFLFPSLVNASPSEHRVPYSSTVKETLRMTDQSARCESTTVFE